jgi:hypothetical protein
MKVSIMQPYFFPYLGYYQLTQASDVFVVLDDVHWINRGWINRNNLLLQGKKHLFTVPVKKTSQNKLISELQTQITPQWQSSFFKTLENAYKKAPFYHQGLNLVKQVIDQSGESLSELTFNSIKAVTEYLHISVSFCNSSDFSETASLKNKDRMIGLCKAVKAQTCINPIGGQQLYDKADFSRAGIELWFLKLQTGAYSQFDHSFVPNLSILDVLMFNSPEHIRLMMEQYTLI